MTKPEQPSEAAVRLFDSLEEWLECLSAKDDKGCVAKLDASLREAYQRGYRQSEVDDNWDGVGDDGYVEGDGDD